MISQRRLLSIGAAFMALGCGGVCALGISTEDVKMVTGLIDAFEQLHARLARTIQESSPVPKKTSAETEPPVAREARVARARTFLVERARHHRLYFEAESLDILSADGLFNAREQIEAAEDPSEQAKRLRLLGEINLLEGSKELPTPPTKERLLAQFAGCFQKDCGTVTDVDRARLRMIEADPNWAANLLGEWITDEGSAFRPPLHPVDPSQRDCSRYRDFLESFIQRLMGDSDNLAAYCRLFPNPTDLIDSLILPETESKVQALLKSTLTDQVLYFEPDKYPLFAALLPTLLDARGDEERKRQALALYAANSSVHDPEEAPDYYWKKIAGQCWSVLPARLRLQLRASFIRAPKHVQRMVVGQAASRSVALLILLNYFEGLTAEQWRSHFLSSFLAAYQKRTGGSGDPQALLQLEEARGLDEALVQAAIEWTEQHPGVQIEGQEDQVMRWMIINGLQPAHLGAEDLHEWRVNMLVDHLAMGSQKETARRRLIASKVQPRFLSRVLDLDTIDRRYQCLLLQPTLFSDLPMTRTTVERYPVPLSTYLTESVVGQDNHAALQAIADPRFDHMRACQENEPLTRDKQGIAKYVAKGEA